MSDRMKELLRQWARHITTDDVCTDGFIDEGMSFPEMLEMMDHIAKAVKEYVEKRC